MCTPYQLSNIVHTISDKLGFFSWLRKTAGMLSSDLPNIQKSPCRLIKELLLKTFFLLKAERTAQIRGCIAQKICHIYLVNKVLGYVLFHCHPHIFIFV